MADESKAMATIIANIEKQTGKSVAEPDATVRRWIELAYADAG